MRNDVGKSLTILTTPMSICSAVREGAARAWVINQRIGNTNISGQIIHTARHALLIPIENSHTIHVLLYRNIPLRQIRHLRKTASLHPSPSQMLSCTDVQNAQDSQIINVYLTVARKNALPHIALSRRRLCD